MKRQSIWKRVEAWVSEHPVLAKGIVVVGVVTIAGVTYLVYRNVNPANEVLAQVKPLKKQLTGHIIKNTASSEKITTGAEVLNLTSTSQIKRNYTSYSHPFAVSGGPMKLAPNKTASAERIAEAANLGIHLDPGYTYRRAYTKGMQEVLDLLSKAG